MCEHHNFFANVDVGRVLKTEGDSKVMRFMADITIKCNDCGEPFRFIGLPAGVDLNGASVSADATEARMAIAPRNEVMSMIEGATTGFSMRRVV